MLYSQLKDIKAATTGPCYSGCNQDQLKQTCKIKMEPIVAYLGKKNFLMGDNITYLDFIMVEMCDFVQFLTNEEFFTENKAIEKYVRRIKGKRQIKKYIATDAFKKPFNNKVAKINNLWAINYSGVSVNQIWCLLSTSSVQRIVPRLSYDIFDDVRNSAADGDTNVPLKPLAMQR